MAAGEPLPSQERSAELDERILYAIRNLHETIVCKTDLKSLLPVLVKFDYLSESRRSVFERKTQSDANASFQILLTREKYRSLRRGFLLALKETATSVSSHNMLLSSLTKAAGVDMKTLEEAHTVTTVSTSAPEQVTRFMPPFKYHCPLDDHPSAIFSSAGGVLYSPVYGVTVYIPSGAILEEEQVEVSFRLVTEEAEIREFLSHVMFKDSVVCSGVFEFEAKVGYSPNRVKVDKFHSDVWIELPHCLSFIEGSLKDYSSAVVVSDSRGKVEVETQALFSEGYPYVNLPVRHFSRFCVQHVQRRFTWSAKCHRGKANASKHSMPKLFYNLRKLSLSSAYESGDSPKFVASPIAQGKQIQSTLLTPYSPSGKLVLLTDVISATTRFPEQPVSQELVDQQSVNTDDDMMMDVDTPIIQEHEGCHSSLDQELLHGASMSLYACVYQPVNRHTRTEWTADIVFTPLLPQALNALIHSSKDECECQTLSFELEASQMRSLCLRSKPPLDLRGWTVELYRTEMLEEFNVQSALPSPRAPTNTAASVQDADASYSKVASFFPKFVARVLNSGAPFSLLYPIEVLRSHPLTHCILSCQIGEDKKEEDQQCGSLHRKRHRCTPDLENSSTAEDLSSGASSAKREKVDTDIVWSQDRYLFVLLSILLPEDTLSDVAKQLRVDELQMMHVQSIPLQSGVGERMYGLFNRAVWRRSLVSFAQLQTCLSTLQSCQRLVPILDSYLIFRSSLDLVSGYLDEDGGYQLLTLFLQWTVTHQPNHSLPTAPDQDGRLIIAQADQVKVFLSLCKQLCSVWRMAARLLGLKDSDIDELGTKYLVDDPCECAYQMLHKWAGSCPTPSDVSYTRLHLVLSVIAQRTCAAYAAFTFVQNRVTNLSKS